TRAELDALVKRTVAQLKRGAAIEPIIKHWLYNEFFSEAANVMIQTQLMTSGSSADINFNLPGNLVKYLVRNGLPYSNVLTADYCVADNGKKRSCDTGAPYSAGILTTRAFMTINYGRFNLGRAGKMMRYFACMDYPMNKKVQIPLKRERLIPLFQTEVATPGADFGNGLACYNCHSQFGAHAQFYVKFDSNGIYQPAATGIQNPDLEAGKSFNGLNASHLLNPAESAAENSQMFGVESENLAAAAKVLASSDVFLECATRNAMHFFLRMTDSEASAIDKDLIQSIVAAARKENPEPTLNLLMEKVLTNDLVIESVLSSGEER
ncbi:MAG: hypothetical protein ABL958_01485, partial [Bdellovibrionia bacterium]